MNANAVAAIALIPGAFVPLLLCAGFARTLLPGRRALITTLATVVRGSALTPRAARYTRAITALWACVLAGMAATTATVAAMVASAVWPVERLALATAAMYLTLVVVFAAEYLFRRWWLPELEHPGFTTFIANVRGADWRTALGAGGRTLPMSGD